FACCRRPDQADALRALAGPLVSLHALDVTDHARIDALAAELRSQPLDVLLNNAGVYGPEKMTLGRLDYRIWAEVLAVNVLGPVKMAEAFVENVAADEQKKIVCFSSLMGSVARNAGGRHYLYRSSKAALNAAVKSLSIDLAPRGVTAVVVHPGWGRAATGGAADPPTPPPNGPRGLAPVRRP